MAEQDAMGDRRRAAEETYFQKKDRELIEKMRAAAASERARHEMSASTGLSDPEALRDLEELGFTPDTVALLPLVPIVRMAWIEGGVTPAERDKILEIARARGVLDGSAADAQLRTWLAARPSDEVFTRAQRLIAAILDTDVSGTLNLSADELLAQCEQIAAASGGIFGIGRISAEERTLLEQVGADLNARRK